MDVKAKLRYLRMSPRKVRLTANLINGMPVAKAENQLAFSKKYAARPILKLLKSAIANAENNNKLKKDNLFVKKITVDQGPTLKRWRARAFGRAGMIRKRSSHVSVVLGELKTMASKKKIAKSASSKADKQPAKDKITKRPVVDYSEIKQEAKGKKDESKSPDEQKKKPSLSFKNIKDKFSRRLGEG
ncbi:50S ribosomal protein L22 [Patescibacteria group bacterium]|nr:50S ribosomal protein L22 [Patescibacteria group bacterium]MBU0963779.1 50S ribosomal protein L22 [Patescibacteria group bacterium]